MEKIDMLGAYIGGLSRSVAKEAVENPPVGLLLGFKGIGYCTAKTALSEIGDIDALCSATKLVRWDGLYLCLHCSGGWV